MRYTNHESERDFKLAIVKYTVFAGESSVQENNIGGVKIRTQARLREETSFFFLS